MNLRMYQYRLYPSQKQKALLFNNFDVCKEIYNNFLEISIKTYETTGKTLRKFDYNKQLSGTYLQVFSQVKQNVSDRVAKSFQNFFRRVKDLSCHEKGFPRFKSRVHSITYPQSGFKFISERRLHVSKIGNIPIVLHRLPKGKVKTLTVKRNQAGQWFAIFASEITVKPVKNKSVEKVGVDVGLMSFATVSNGLSVDNPRFLKKSEKRLALLQRRLSRKRLRSRNRLKAKHLVAKQHLRVSNQRLDFLHKTSKTFVDQYCFIAVEGLNIKGMVHNHHLAKSINDASWGNFIRMLEYKAVTSGSTLVKVNPRNTSKTCSHCGAVADMPLNQRQYCCGVCGFVCHRDLNASINILKVGLDESEPNARGHDVRPPMVVVVDEAGTICDNIYAS